MIFHFQFLFFRFLVENRKLEMPPKEMRNLSDLLQGIRNNNLKEVKTIIERRFSKKDRGNQLLLAGELGERYAKEIEAAILEASRLTDPSILKYLIKNGAQVIAGTLLIQDAFILFRIVIANILDTS